MTVLVKEIPATFIHIPKNAGVAISNWLTINVPSARLLEKHNGGKHAVQSTVREYRNNNPKEGPMGFTFVCVRNPWARVVSVYHYYVRRGKIDPTVMPWESFLDRQWENEAWGCADKPQVEYFDDVDYIIKFENIVKDFYTVQKHFNAFKPLYKFNKSNHKDYRFYYKDPRTVDEVAKHYHKDIERFGYSFE